MCNPKFKPAPICTVPIYKFSYRMHNHAPHVAFSYTHAKSGLLRARDKKNQPNIYMKYEVRIKPTASRGGADLTHSHYLAKPKSTREFVTTTRYSQNAADPTELVIWDFYYFSLGYIQSALLASIYFCADSAVDSQIIKALDQFRIVRR